MPEKFDLQMEIMFHAAVHTIRVTKIKLKSTNTFVVEILRHNIKPNSLVMPLISGKLF